MGNSSPLHRCVRRASTPPKTSLPPVRATADHRVRSRSVRVVSRHFDGLLRSSIAGLLHPATNHGVHCVSSRRRAVLFQGSSRAPWSPQCGSHPSKKSPPTQPHRVSATVTPSSLFHRKLRFRSTSRCCSECESVALGTIAGVSSALLPGLRSLQACACSGFRRQRTVRRTFVFGRGAIEIGRAHV